MGRRPGRKVKGLGMNSHETKPKGSPMILWEKYLDNLEKKRMGVRRNFRVIDNHRSGSTSYSGDLSSPIDTTLSLSPSGSI